jgi:polar amino acid transport system ATP-binding protein
MPISDKAEPQACGQRHELRRSTERGALAARQCDLVARAMTITKARQQNLTFSDPYLDGGVIVEEGPPADVLSTPQRPRTKAFLSRVL